MSGGRKEEGNRRPEVVSEAGGQSLLTRRNLLITGGLAALFGGAIYYLLKESSDQEKVQRFVEGFPANELPGKPITRIIPHKGATHALVNFETMHSNPLLKLDEPSRQIIIQLQEEKLAIMEWCMRDVRVKMDMLFREGLTDESTPGIRQSEEEARGVLKRQADALPPRARARFWLDKRQELLFQFGAEGLLSFDEKLPWEPAESAQELQGGDPRDGVNAEAREAVLLQRLREQKRVIAFTSWGAMHWPEERIPEDFSFISIRGRFLDEFIRSGANLKGSILNKK